MAHMALPEAIPGAFWHRFAAFSSRFASFRIIFALFCAVLDRSESFSDRFERRTLRTVREDLQKIRENFAKNSRIACFNFNLKDLGASRARAKHLFWKGDSRDFRSSSGNEWNGHVLLISSLTVGTNTFL